MRSAVTFTSAYRYEAGSAQSTRSGLNGGRDGRLSATTTIHNRPEIWFRREKKVKVKKSWH